MWTCRLRKKQRKKKAVADLALEEEIVVVEVVQIDLEHD